MGSTSGGADAGDGGVARDAGAVMDAGAPGSDASDAQPESGPDSAASPCVPACTTTAPSTANCVIGRCVVTLASGQRSPTSLAVDSARVYWLNASGTSGLGLYAVSIAGGAPAALGAPNSVGSQLSDNVLAIDANNAYWGGYPGLYRTPLDGGATTALATTGYPEGVAIDSTNVYWTAGTTVQSVPLLGGTPIALATMQQNPDGIAVDAQRVYWAANGQSFGGGAVFAVALDGGTPTTLATDTGGPGTLVLSGGNAYWNDVTNNVYPDGISTVPLASDGGSPTSVVAPPSAQALIAGFAIDGSTVYYSSNDGTVHKAPLDGSAQPTLLISGLKTPQAVRVDATSVYFTDLQGGTVTKVTPK
jgi:hypothetical protein